VTKATLETDVTTREQESDFRLAPHVAIGNLSYSCIIRKKKIVKNRDAVNLLSSWRRKLESWKGKKQEGEKEAAGVRAAFLLKIIRHDLQDKQDQ
jgi:hypothetical protein